MRKKYRTIVVAGISYRWHRYHRHAFGPDGTKQCHEILAVYDTRSKRAPVRFIFGQRAGWWVGYPLDGVLGYGSGDAAVVFNLNRPAVVAALIAGAVHMGWEPLLQPKPLELVNRFDLLLDHCHAASGYG